MHGERDSWLYLSVFPASDGALLLFKRSEGERSPVGVSRQFFKGECVCVLKRVRVAVQWPRKKFQMLRNLSLLGILCVCVCQWGGGHENSRKTQTHHKHTLPNVLLHTWTNPHVFTDSTLTHAASQLHRLHLFLNSLRFRPNFPETLGSFSRYEDSPKTFLFFLLGRKKKASGATLTPTNAETSFQKKQ